MLQVLKFNHANLRDVLQQFVKVHVTRAGPFSHGLLNTLLELIQMLRNLPVLFVFRFCELPCLLKLLLGNAHVAQSLVLVFLKLAQNVESSS